MKIQFLFKIWILNNHKLILIKFIYGCNCIILLDNPRKIIKLQVTFYETCFYFFIYRLLSVICCNLDSLLLLEAQYQVSEMLLNAQEENTLDTSENHR